MKTVTFNDLQPGQILAVIIWPDSPGHYSSGVFGAVIDDGDDWEEQFVAGTQRLRLALWRLAAGKPKRFTAAELARRRARMKQLNQDRAKKQTD